MKNSIFLKIMSLGLVFISTSLFAVRHTEAQMRRFKKMAEVRRNFKFVEGECCICAESFDCAAPGCRMYKLMDLCIDSEIPREVRIKALFKLLNLGRWKITLLCCGNRDNFICSNCILRVVLGDGGCPICRQLPISGILEIGGKSIAFDLPIPLSFLLKTELLFREVYREGFVSQDELTAVVKLILKEPELASHFKSIDELVMRVWPDALRKVRERRQ